MDGLARWQGSCSDGQGTCSAVNDYAFVFFVSFKIERKKSIRKTYLMGRSAPREARGTQTIEKAASLGVSVVFVESCKQGETRRSTFATSCCFFKRGRAFLIMGNLGSWVQGPLLQDKAQHNAVEPGAPRCWEERRKVGSRKGGSRSWPGLGGEGLDLFCMNHEVAKPTHAPGRAPTLQDPLCPRGTLS